MSHPTRRSKPQITILDGGMSRELVRLNAPFRMPEWTALSLMQQPASVTQVHHDFITAGADIITTNSYALVPTALTETGFWSKGEDLANLASRLARQAADTHNNTLEVDSDNISQKHNILVAGSLPPIFGSYEPSKFNPDRVQDYLSVLVRGLREHIDIWLGETLSLIAEGDAVLQAVGFDPSTNPSRTRGPKIWISFTLNDTADLTSLAQHNDGDANASARLRSGETVTAATKWALRSRIDALLFNCSRPEFMTLAVREAASTVRDTDTNHDLHIGLYANAFVKDDADYAAHEQVTEIRTELTPDMYAGFAREWIDEGASIIGGCCGIGRDHIRELACRFKTGGGGRNGERIVLSLR